MTSAKKLFCVAALLSLPATFVTAKIGGRHGNFEYNFFGTFRPEGFFGKNTVHLNSNNCDTNKIFYLRHVVDLSAEIIQHNDAGTAQPIHFQLTLRDRANWGNSGSVASTNPQTIKLGEAVVGEHKHTFPRHIFWIREAWMKLDIGELVDIPYQTKLFFTLGAFPFELGRGISLGTAYAVGPGFLGFLKDDIVDQYAFGGKFHGELLDKRTSYDLYAAILDCRTSSIAEVGEKIRGQEYGRLERPARGFGHIGFLIAGRVFWKILDEKKHKFTIEPYALFGHQPEQKVVFRGDASGRLGTVGLAGEYSGCHGELGFDCALNMGSQHVRGWDKNEIKLYTDKTTGMFSLINNKVYNAPSGTSGRKNIPYTTSDNTQDIISYALRDAKQNGQKIGVSTGGTELYNADDRFRNPYTNKFQGWMAVIDGCINLGSPDFKACVTAGYTSGDSDPHECAKDGTYDGFIPLQEAYSGKRVRSAFLLGGFGKPRRVLTRYTNINQRRPAQFNNPISGFTNLVICGGALQWTRMFGNRKLKIHPNIQSYWLAQPDLRYDAEKGVTCCEFASRHTGVETNLFLDYYPLPNLRAFCVTSVFFPGQYYTDTKGRPISTEEQLLLDKQDRTGFNKDRVPNSGDDISYTLSGGLEFKF